VSDRAPRKKSPFQEQREAIRTRLEGIGQELERIIAEAKKPGTPAHAELSIRASSRLADGIGRRAEELKDIRAPEPWVTAPTRERVRQAGEEPRRDVVYVAGAAQDVSHRFTWPVDRLHQLHIVDPDTYMSASRLYRAYNRLPRPLTGRYGDERGGDPANKLMLTEPQETALREVEYIWRATRSTPFWRWIKALVLLEPEPGSSRPMGLVDFGRQQGKTNSEQLARWFAHGFLDACCILLVELYRTFDARLQAEAKERQLAQAREIAKHRRAVPNSNIKRALA
jgi:hypothetical protein